MLSAVVSLAASDLAVAKALVYWEIVVVVVVALVEKMAFL